MTKADFLISRHPARQTRIAGIFPNMANPRAPAPLSNPTSTKATVYTYTCIALILLYKYLDDDPRHVRYRDAQRKTSPEKQNMRYYYDSQIPESPPPRRSEKHPRPRYEYEYQDVSARTRERPSRTQDRDTLSRNDEHIRYSRAHDRQAWTRMRSVTPSKCPLFTFFRSGH